MLLKWFTVLLATAAGLGGAEVEWEPTSNMNGQLFPSLLIATASVRPDDEEEEEPDVLGDPYGLLGVSVKAPAANTRVKVTLLEKFKGSLASAALESLAWKSFERAVNVGTRELQKHQAKFENEDEPDYVITDIAEARADGIMPISYEKAE